MSKIICNNFGGIRQITPEFSKNIITAKDMQNVELYFTGENNGVGIRTQNGNTNVLGSLIPSDEKIINIFKSVQNNQNYLFIHTVSSTEGKVYLWYNSTLTAKITGLSVTSVSEGVDYAQGNRDLFIFANGVDDLHYIEIGASPDNGTITAVDSESRAIKGLGLVNYAGRVWTFTENRLHYCVTSNVNDWATSSSSTPTSAGYVEFGKKITAIYPYIFSLVVFFEDSSVIITGEYPFNATEDAPGGCAGYNACAFHGTDLFFYDDTKKGVYCFQQVVIGDRTLGNNIALNIQEEFDKIDKTRINELKMLSVNYDDRNEIWLLLPTTGDYSTILIFDYLKKEWVKRKSQKLTSLRMYNQKLYSASGRKLLQEYQGTNFDGENINAFYYMSPFNGGSNSTLKGLWSAPKITLQEGENNFWVKYVKDMNVFKQSINKKITASFKNYMEWSVSLWNTTYWYSKNAVCAFCKLPKPALFKTLEIQVYTKNAHETFNIQSLEFSEIQSVQT